MTLSVRASTHWSRRENISSQHWRNIFHLKNKQNKVGEAEIELFRTVKLRFLKMFWDDHHHCQQLWELQELLLAIRNVARELKMFHNYRVQGTGDVEIYEMLECIPHLELIFSYWESFSYLFDMFSLLLYETNEYLILFFGRPCNSQWFREYGLIVYKHDSWTTLSNSRNIILPLGNNSMLTANPIPKDGKNILVFV